MQLPIQTTFRGVDRSDALDTLIRDEASKLERFFDRIISCRVLVEPAHEHQRRGSPFHVRIELGVPGEEIVVRNLPSAEAAPPADDLTPVDRKKSDEFDAALKDPQLAIRDAFRKAGRRLQDYARRKSGAVKAHEAPATGEVARLIDGYGFLRTSDGRDLYFHRNSVLNGRFDALHAGSLVRFVEEEGENGPQASTVHVISSE